MAKNANTMLCVLSWINLEPQVYSLTSYDVI
nr:MAG TPA: hypothetical protein [Caudoviricetes sp.]